MDVDLLHPFAAAAIRGVDDDLLHKLIEHGRCQRRKIRVPLRHCKESVCPVGVLIVAVKLCLLCGSGLL